MYQEPDGQTVIEEDDQCFTCSYFHIQQTCPLLEALSENVAYLAGDIRVRNCRFYKEFKRNLTLVGNTDEPRELEIEPPGHHCDQRSNLVKLVFKSQDKQ